MLEISGCNPAFSAVSYTTGSRGFSSRGLQYFEKLSVLFLVWYKTVWIGCEGGLKLPQRHKPHFSDFSVAKRKVSNVQVFFNKKDVVIFIVDVVPVIE